MLYDSTVAQNLTKLNANLSKLELAVDSSKADKTAEEVLAFKALNETNAGVLVQSADYVDRLKLLAKTPTSQTQQRLNLSSIDGVYRRLKQCLVERETRKTKLLDLNSQIKSLIDTTILSEADIARLTLQIPILEKEYADWVAAGSNQTLTRIGSDILGDIATTKKSIVDLRGSEEKDVTKIAVLKDEYEVTTRDLMLYTTIYQEIINTLKIDPNWGEAELEADEIPCMIRSVFKKAKLELITLSATSVTTKTGEDDYNLSYSKAGASPPDPSEITSTSTAKDISNFGRDVTSTTTPPTDATTPTGSTTTTTNAIQLRRLVSGSVVELVNTLLTGPVKKASITKQGVSLGQSTLGELEDLGIDSAEAQQIILKMLSQSPSTNMTPTELVEYPWGTKEKFLDWVVTKYTPNVQKRLATNGMHPSS